MSMQAIVDHSMKFLDISVGYPGSLHDSRVFSLSSFSKAVVSGELTHGSSQFISGVHLGPLLIGDSDYPIGL